MGIKTFQFEEELKKSQEGDADVAGKKDYDISLGSDDEQQQIEATSDNVEEDADAMSLD